MERISLPKSDRKTTRLGFGCSGISGATGRRHSLDLLEGAFDAGIRHFDVAPMYGHGTAEAVLGEFIRRHPGQVSVATKYGILPPRAGNWLSAARGMLRPVVNKIPALKKRMLRAASSIASPAVRASFSAGEAKTSLEASLRHLGTDRIDLFLMHDASADDLYREDLLRLLEDATAAGKIAAFGVSSSAPHIDTLLQHRPAWCNVLQYQWSAPDPVPASDAHFRVHHRTLSAAWGQRHQWLREHPGILSQWSNRTGIDLSQPANFAQLLFKAGLVYNPGSIILFSSTQSKHITQNVLTASDSSLTVPAKHLYQLLKDQPFQSSEAISQAPSLIADIA